MKESNAFTSNQSQNNQNLTQQSEDKTLRLFLDFLIDDIQKNADSLVPYTEEMSKELDELLEGVI
jgi:antitoxin PrlF